MFPSLGILLITLMILDDDKDNNDDEDDEDDDECFDRVSLCSPGWSETHSDPPVSASQVLGIKGMHHHT